MESKELKWQKQIDAREAYLKVMEEKERYLKVELRDIRKIIKLEKAGIALMRAEG